MSTETDDPFPLMNLVEDEDREARYAICKACDELTTFKTCKQCNCVMPVKVVWAGSECPLGKWGKINSTISSIPPESAS
jgi:hypothetical protein